MDEHLKVENVSKSFKGFQLHDISFTLPKGYIMGLIGPNGSGKTTTIKLLLNMLKRESGQIQIMGMDNVEHEREIKSLLGVVFDSNYLCDSWTVAQSEKAVSMFYNNWDHQKFAELLARFQIDKAKKVKELSKGMQMKLMLACALSYDAKLLILDEPTGGLDPVSRDELLGLLSAYIEDGEHSVLYSTHITSDLERAADFITYIRRGEVFFTGEKDAFVNMYRVVKGGLEDLTPEISRLCIGVRRHPTGFEALVPAEQLSACSGLVVEPASIDDIMVFTNRKGENDD